MIEYTAPGKAVIWGEYAVLEGAPALVMAVDRYASTRISPGRHLWHIVASGFAGEATLSGRELTVCRTGVAAVVGAALSAFDTRELPAGAEVHTDTSTFHEGTDKLGIGSSAAICAATCAALAEFLDQPFSFERALTAHQALQGRAGSGLDVAAACHGGLIRFQERMFSPAHWPENFHYRFVFAGHSSSTIDHLARFFAWRTGNDTLPLRKLCEASEALFSRLDMDTFRNYVDCLRTMDGLAGLGIFGEAHQRLSKLANRTQVVYKPCGAGGGDIGIAVSDDATALNSFVTLAARESFLILDLETATHGVHRNRR